ncbi:MAG: DNA-processing protein DprA [Nitrospirota bacterium]
MNIDDSYYWIGLRLIPGLGDYLYKKLLAVFGSPEKVFSASVSQIKGVEGIGEKAAKEIVSFSYHKKVVEEIAKIKEMGISLITMNDEEYPDNLRHIYDPPPMLYMKGMLKDVDKRSVAIVGSRNASGYGKWIAGKISRGLGSKGFTVVSGMARGIDSSAHKGAIESGGRTIAVIGCGIDTIYPPENKMLMKEILRAGAVISEFMIGTKPASYNFPRRNRIISGFSLGTLIVEASSRSGSLITAKFALEQGRELFAIPGNIGAKNSMGTNSLIKNGAKLVDNEDDIIEELLPQLEDNLKFKKGGNLKEERNIPELSTDEEIIYNFLSLEPTHVDEVIIKSMMSSNRVSALLLDLELKGIIKRISGGMFIREV